MNFRINRRNSGIQAEYCIVATKQFKQPVSNNDFLHFKM